MKKYLRVTHADGVWELPASVIANAFAAYHEMNSPGTYAREYDLIMEDDGLLMDWAQNDMNWAEVKDAAVMVESIAPDYEETWTNGEHEVVAH